MKTNLYVDTKITDEHVDFFLQQLTPEIQHIVDQMGGLDSFLWGYDERKIIPVKFDEIYRIYASNDHVVAEIDGLTVKLKQKLYQVALVLPKDFIRVSRSEIINYHRIDHLEVSGNGLINIILNNHSRALVPRRYMSILKERIGL